MSSPINDHKTNGENLVNLLPLHLQTIYQLRPSNTFNEGQIKLSEKFPKSMVKSDSLQTNSEIFSPSRDQLHNVDLSMAKRNTLSSTSTPSDISKVDSIPVIPGPLYDHRSRNKILRASYNPPQSFLYNWTIPVNMNDIRSFVHSELITEQNFHSIIFIQRQIRLIRRSSAILKLLESAHQRALIIPRIMFRLWHMYAFITRMYRRILHKKVFGTWRIEMLFRVKHKQMEYLCNIFLQSKYFACFKERARINTQLNLFVVTFMKRINLRVTNDIFQFFLYLMKYLKMYRKQLKAFIEQDERQTNENQNLQLSLDNPLSVYKDLIRGMPIKFYDIAKSLIPTRSVYLIDSFVSDIQYRVKVTLYIRLNLLRYTLISPIFVGWLTTIRMLRIRKAFLLLTYDKLLITAFYRWSDLARGRHRLMTKYLGMWKQYISKLRLQRYKILLANQFRVKSLAQTYLRRWEDYCLSKDIVRLLSASILAGNSGYVNFFICTVHLLMNGTCVYDTINRRIVKKIYILDSYIDDGRVGYHTVEDDDGFLMLPGDVATKIMEDRKIKEREVELQRKETQLRNLFDAHISSRQTKVTDVTFLTQQKGMESDSEDESSKRLVAHPPRIQSGDQGVSPLYCMSYQEEFCLKFRIFQIFKQRPMARRSFLRFILLLQATDRIYKQIISLQLWKKYVLANKEHLAKQKEKLGGITSRIFKDASHDIFLTDDITNQSGNNLSLLKSIDSELVSQHMPDSFIRSLFFKTHSLVLLTLLHKMAHSPSMGSVINVLDFIPDLNIHLFKSVTSKILSFSTKQLEDTCYLTTKSSLGTCLSTIKTMQLFASIAVLYTNFNYKAFPHQKTNESSLKPRVSTWDKRMTNLQSILSCCSINTIYSLLKNYNKLQAITKMETDLLEKYQSIEVDITAMGEHNDPSETIIPRMLQEDISVINLFTEKQNMIKTILNTKGLADNSSSLLERLKRERSYIVKDATELTDEIAHELLLFDTRASNSLLLKRLLDAVSTEISVGMTSKLEARLTGTTDSPRRGGGNKMRVAQITEDLDAEEKVLKSALCECFLASQNIPPSFKQACEAVTFVQSNNTLSHTVTYCHICSGCLCLYCACSQRCRCMKNTMMRRSLIFSNYLALTYESYKRIDAALVFLSDINGDYDSTSDDYILNLSVSSRCYHICETIYLRRQIDKDCLRLLLINNSESPTILRYSLNSSIPAESVVTDAEGKIYATLDNESDEPAAKVIVAHIQRKNKNKNKSKKRAKGHSTSPTLSPKKNLQHTMSSELTTIPNLQPAQTLEDFEIGKTADLLINYANRELIERLDAYKKIEGHTSQNCEVAICPKSSVRVTSASALKNAMLYTGVVFTVQSSGSSIPQQSVYLSLDALHEGFPADYNDTIASLQHAQERLLSLELSETVKYPTEALSHLASQATAIGTSSILPKSRTNTGNRIDTQQTHTIVEQLGQDSKDDNKLRLESSSTSSKPIITHDFTERRHQITISENSSVYSTSNPNCLDSSTTLHDPIVTINSTSAIPISVKDQPFKHSAPKAGASSGYNTSIDILVTASEEPLSNLEIKSSRGLPTKSYSIKPSEAVIRDNLSIQSKDDHDNDSSEASLLELFKDLSPEKESSSRSILISSQMKSREKVRQISQQLDEELSRISSTLPYKSTYSRPHSSEAESAGILQHDDIKHSSPLPVNNASVDIDTDLDNINLSLQRLFDTQYNASRSTSRCISTGKPATAGRPVPEESSSQMLPVTMMQENFEDDNELQRALQTQLASDASRGITSSHSDRSTKDRYGSAHTAINMPLETVMEVNSSLVDTQLSAIQPGIDNATTSTLIIPQCNSETTTSDKILDILQNIQAKFIDVEADSAEERVANLFKHLQEPPNDSIDIATEKFVNEAKKHASTDRNTEENTSDDDFKLSLKSEPTIELLQLNMNLERTISRQMQLRTSKTVASPRVGNKSVSRLIHQKLLDELGRTIPKSNLDDSAFRMQSGLISTPFESMNVTEISINPQYSRLQHIEERVHSITDSKNKHWREQQAILQYAREVDDLNLSSSESLLRNEDDSFIIDLNSTDSSSLSLSDLILSGASSFEKNINQEGLDMTELPDKDVQKNDGANLKDISRPRLLQKNKKVGKIETRYDHRPASENGTNKRIPPEFALRKLNIAWYNRILGEYRQAPDVSSGERTVSSADARKVTTILRKNGKPLQESGVPILPKYKWRRLTRVSSSPIMKYSERHGMQKPKRRSPLYVHLAKAKKEANIHLPTLDLYTDTGLAGLGNNIWNAPMKFSQRSLLTKRVIDRHRYVSKDPIISPIYLTSESSNTSGKTHVKPEYISAWRKIKRLKYIDSANMIHNVTQFANNIESLDPSIIPAPEPIRSPIESMRNYIVSTIDANIFITQQANGDEKQETTQSIQEISCPSAIIEDMPSSPKSSEDSNQRYVSHIQKRNREFVRMLEECLLTDPITSKYSEMINLIPVNTSSLFDLSTEQTLKDEKADDYTLIREFAKAAPKTVLQSYSDLEADTRLQKHIEQTKVELTTLNATANSYYSPTTISIQNSTNTPTVIKKQLEDDDPGFTLTPLSVWEAKDAQQNNTYIASYPEVKMTDEEFHNIVLSQTFEVLSKAIQLAHGNQMITAQRCRESIEAKKMNVLEIAAGSRRSQITRDLCNKNAQLMFSRAVNNALHRKLYNVNATPIIRGFGLRDGAPTPEFLHGGPDLLSSLMRWRHRMEGRSNVPRSCEKTRMYIVQSHKLTKGEATAFHNSLWISPGRKPVLLDVSNFKLVGSPTHPGATLKQYSHNNHSLINVCRKGVLHNISPCIMKRGHTMSIGVLARACAAESGAMLVPQITAEEVAHHSAVPNGRSILSERFARMQIGCTYFVSGEQKQDRRAKHPSTQYKLNQILRIHSKPMLVSDQRVTSMKTVVHIVDMNGRPLQKDVELPPKPHGAKYCDSPKSPRHEMGIRLPTSETSKKNALRPVPRPLHPESKQGQLLTVQGILHSSPVVGSSEKPRENANAYLKHRRKSGHLPGTLGQIPSSNTDTSISLTDDEDN